MTFASSTFARFFVPLSLAAVIALGCGGSGSSSTSTTSGTTGTTGAGGGATTTGSGGSGGGSGGSGTGGSGACVPQKAATFSGDVYPILQQSCSGVEGCHQLLVKTPANAYGWLVGQPADCPDGRSIVDPGHPEKSYLIDKLKDQDLCMDSSPMPKKAIMGPFVPLPDAQIQAFSDWICAGAKDD
ncbi:MAG: hypothetical protein U0359_07940 [Byssovorax sp.]